MLYRVEKVTGDCNTPLLTMRAGEMARASATVLYRVNTLPELRSTIWRSVFSTIVPR